MQLVRAFLGGCIAAPVGVLTYYYLQDPDMTKGAPIAVPNVGPRDKCS